MELLVESITELWQGAIKMAPRILIALIVLLIFIWVGRTVGRIIVHLLGKGNFRPTHQSFFRSLTAWIFGIFGVIIGLHVVGLKTLATSLLAGGSMTAIVLGFAFREVGENFLAGFFLAFSRPFQVGDLIQSGEFQGIVRAIELRSTHIRSADGRDIFVPSSQIFKDALVNFTKDGLRRLSFKVGIDYADDSGKARELLAHAVDGIEYVLADPHPRANLSSLEPNYVNLEVAFWVDTFQKGTDLVGVRNEVIERCRRTLMDNGFTVSSNVTTNVALGGFAPVQVRLDQPAAS
jgi:small-conductance mechanosensitive channel